eukprot:gene27459-33162_t
MEDLHHLFEPIQAECICALYMLEQKDYFYTDRKSLVSSPPPSHENHRDIVCFQQIKRSCLLVCQSEQALYACVQLYQDLPPLPYKDCPPLMVLVPNKVQFIAPQAPAPCPAIPAPLTPFLIPSNPSTHAAPQQPPTAEGPADGPAATERTLLPACSLCLRRLKGAVRGGGQIMVGRSFTYPPTLPPVEGAWGQRGERVLATRCMACEVYYRANASSLSLVVGSPPPPPPAQLPAESSSAPPPPQVPACYPPLGGCSQCSLCENIWMCLVCAEGGCGRYAGQHAYTHYLHPQHTQPQPPSSSASSPQHIYALELASGRVWDYRADTFAHFENSPLLFFAQASSSAGEVLPLTSLQDLSPRPGDA